ncbi:MAG: YheC/YheD family protein [Syntrophomonadaceae bacterium]|nr:YheC/YheD family protein [Syntrophomonadaceae bacterium]
MKITGKIFISQSLIYKLAIPVQPFVQVRVGSLIVTARMVMKKNSRKSYMLSPDLARALYIKKHRRLRIRYDQENDSIHLGPTIGILSSYLPNREEFDPRSTQAELIFLSDMGKKLSGQTYIFTPGSINWANKTARGYTYRHVSPARGIWVSSIYPLPDVVYDRISSRTSEGRKVVKSTKRRLMEISSLKYFNPSFLNKWKVYQMLIGNPELQLYLPETRQLNLESLEEMLEKYPALYLKPSNGSLGKGIIKVRHDNKGNLRYVIYRGRRIRSQASNAEELFKKTRKARKGRAYIVQSDLNLATFTGAPFDIRIIYQKNSRGEWQISKKFVRIAPRGSSISNLSSGGRPEKSSRVLKRLFRKKSVINEKNAEIKKLCSIVAKTLEEACNANFGELGLDIGITKDGNPCLIEVNSKPRKTTETQLSAAIVRNTFRRPLEYSIYLAGFNG